MIIELGIGYVNGVKGKWVDGCFYPEGYCSHCGEYWYGSHSCVINDQAVAEGKQ